MGKRTASIKIMVESIRAIPLKETKTSRLGYVSLNLWLLQ